MGFDLWSIQQSQVLKTFDDSVLKGILAENHSGKDG